MAWISFAMCALTTHVFVLPTDDNFASIVAAVREGRVVWDNLRKVLFVNTPINNAQGLSVLFGIACGLGYTPLSSIQVLYSNLITACTQRESSTDKADATLSREHMSAS